MRERDSSGELRMRLAGDRPRSTRSAVKDVHAVRRAIKALAARPEKALSGFHRKLERNENRDSRIVTRRSEFRWPRRGEVPSTRRGHVRGNASRELITTPPPPPLLGSARFDSMQQQQQRSSSSRSGKRRENVAARSRVRGPRGIAISIAPRTLGTRLHPRRG